MNASPNLQNAGALFAMARAVAEYRSELRMAITISMGGAHVGLGYRGKSASTDSNELGLFPLGGVLMKLWVYAFS